MELRRYRHGNRSTCSPKCKARRTPGYSEPDPAPEEIEERAREIRAEWTYEDWIKAGNLER